MGNVAGVAGASVEFHQKFVEDCVSEVSPWMADSLGALLTAWLYLVWLPYRKLLEFPLPPRKKAPRI